MAGKYVGRCSTALTIREVHIDTSVRCSLTPMMAATLRQNRK